MLPPGGRAWQHISAQESLILQPKTKKGNWGYFPDIIESRVFSLQLVSTDTKIFLLSSVILVFFLGRIDCQLFVWFLESITVCYVYMKKIFSPYNFCIFFQKTLCKIEMCLTCWGFSLCWPIRYFTGCSSHQTLPWSQGFPASGSRLLGDIYRSPAGGWAALIGVGFGVWLSWLPLELPSAPLPSLLQSSPPGDPIPTPALSPPPLITSPNPGCRPWPLVIDTMILQLQARHCCSLTTVQSLDHTENT